ncbi:MAG TPA: outer membrane beta-barrel protein [Opitutus sp.]|nr:outer membrane beta-barrel protein [Opitutus sp.]
MKLLSSSLFSALIAATAFADSKAYVETGASYIALRDARFESRPDPLHVDGGRSKVAPFIAAGYSFTERLGLRLSYHFLDDIRASAEFPHSPGHGDVHLPVVVWGHYRDDVHLVGLAPELRWARGDKLTFTFSPGLNWVASRGHVSYGTVETVPMTGRKQSDEGFTLGGSVGLVWALAERSAVSLNYQYTDLDPSFGREAHLLTGGVRFSF